jgi:hypothetical protein
MDDSLIETVSVDRQTLHSADSPVARIFMLDKTALRDVTFPEDRLPTAHCIFHHDVEYMNWYSYVDCLRMNPSYSWMSKYEYVIKADDDICFLHQNWDKLLVEAMPLINHPCLNGNVVNDKGMIINAPKLVIYKMETILKTGIFQCAYSYPKVLGRLIPGSRTPNAEIGDRKLIMEGN